MDNLAFKGIAVTAHMALCNAFSMNSHVCARLNVKTQHRKNSETRQEICKWLGYLAQRNVNLFLATSVSQTFLNQIPLHSVFKVTDVLIMALMQITRDINLKRPPEKPARNVLSEEAQKKTNEDKKRLFNTPALSIYRGTYCPNPFPSRPTLEVTVCISKKIHNLPPIASGPFSDWGPTT